MDQAADRRSPIGGGALVLTVEFLALFVALLNAEIAFAHIGLIASKLGKKASTNLGAIQVKRLGSKADANLLPKRLPTPPPAYDCRHEGKRCKPGGENWKQAREQADQSEQSYRFGAFGYATQIIEALLWHLQRDEPPALRHYGKGQKTRSGAHKGEQQERSRQPVGCGVSQHKSKRDGGVKEKVERNVEKGSLIGGTGQTRHSPIKPVQEPVQYDQKQAKQKLATRNCRNGGESYREAYEGDAVRRSAPRVQPAGRMTQQFFLHWYNMAVEHAIPFPLAERAGPADPGLVLLQS